MGGQGWQLPTQVLEDQLTLSRPEGADCAPTVLLAQPTLGSFQTVSLMLRKFAWLSLDYCVTDTLEILNFFGWSNLTEVSTLNSKQKENKDCQNLLCEDLEGKVLEFKSAVFKDYKLGWFDISRHVSKKTKDFTRNMFL